MGSLRSGLFVALCLLGFSCASASSRRNGDKMESCYRKCDKSKDCKDLQNVIPQSKVDDCVDFITDTCDDDERDFKTCLSSYKESTNGGCTDKITSSAIPCLLCQVDCEEANEGISSMMPNNDDRDDDDDDEEDDDDDEEDDDDDDEDDDEEECLEKCDNTKECMASSELSETMEENCNNFAKQFCGNSSIRECAKQMKDEENAMCPKTVRDASLACWECEDKCEMSNNDDDEDEEEEEEEENGSADSSGDEEDDDDEEDMSPCMKKCNQTETCMAINTEDESTLDMCDDWIDEYCDKAASLEECLDANKTEDMNCPEPLRNQLNQCLKCQKQCDAESGKAMETTQEKCKRNCDESDSCSTKGDSTKPLTCGDCVKNACKNPDDMLTCMITSVAGGCRDSCSPFGNACLQCKAACDTP